MQKSSARRAMGAGPKPKSKPSTAVKVVRSAAAMAKKAGGLKAMKIKLKFNEPKKAK